MNPIWGGPEGEGLCVLTRPLPRAFAAQALSRAARDQDPIDPARAEAQHQAYVAALRALAPRARWISAEAAHELADSVFVEDLAIALPGGALLTRPGAPSRRPEREGVERALREAGLPILATLQAPATLDGGDVLRLPDRVLCGLSHRSNTEGLDALRAAAAPLPVQALPVPGDELHLKSMLSWVGPELGLLVAAAQEAWVREVLRPALGEALAGLGGLTGLADPLAANVLRVGDAVLWQGQDEVAFQALRARTLRWRRVDCSELAKADGALTCCSVILSGL